MRRFDDFIKCTRVVQFAEFTAISESAEQMLNLVLPVLTIYVNISYLNENYPFYELGGIKQWVAWWDPSHSRFTYLSMPRLNTWSLSGPCKYYYSPTIYQCYLTFWIIICSKFPYRQNIFILWSTTWESPDQIDSYSSLFSVIWRYWINP